MATDISRSTLEAACDTACECFTAALNVRLFSGIAWANAKMKADGIAGTAAPEAIEKFAEEGKQTLEALAVRCDDAEQALTADVLDFIAEANAPHNLPGATMDGIRYTTAHQGAIYFAKGILAAAKTAAEQKQWENNIGQPTSTRETWEAIIEAIRKMPIPGFQGTDIEREAANAVRYLEGDKKGDKKKKPRRPLTAEATDCIRLYNRRVNSETKRPSMKAICKEYAEENGGSCESIYRTVKDHPAEWKGDKKGTK